MRLSTQCVSEQLRIVRRSLYLWNSSGKIGLFVWHL